MRLDPATIDLRAAAAGVQLRPVVAAVQLALYPQWVALACGSVLLDQPGFLLRREYAAAADTMAVDAGKNLADEVESSDSFAAAACPVWNEAATAVDSFSASFWAYLDLTEATGASDAIRTLVSAAWKDAVSASDAAYRTVASVRTETITATDGTPVFTVTDANTDSVLAADTSRFDVSDPSAEAVTGGDAQFSGVTKVLGEVIVATDQMSYVVDVAAVINQVELNGGVL